jgi:RNA polymerase sigma-70 factor (ECF subfamily)
MNLELCREAIRLAGLLVGEPRVVNRDTLGLLALMNFHLARSGSRVDERGAGVPLDLQDRERWDRERIEQGGLLLEIAQAVALGYAGDARGAIANVVAVRAHPLLQGSHVPSAVLAHLHAMLGEESPARRYAEESASLGGTPQEQRVMQEQVERLLARAG